MSGSEERPAGPGADVVWIDSANENVPPRDLTIRSVATMFRVPVVVLRYYEFRGLIRRRHRSGGRRVYGWADCDRIAFIVKGRRAGLSLGDIAVLFAAEDADASVETLARGRDTGLAMIEHLEGRLRETVDALTEVRRIFNQVSATFVERNGRR